MYSQRNGFEVAACMLAAATAVLAGCSDGEATAGAEKPATPLARNYPAGGAQVLSVVEASSIEGSGPFEVAMNCVVALQTISGTLADMQVSLREAEIDGLRRAHAVYQSRLRSAGAKEGRTTREIATMLEEKVQEAQDNPGPQLQLVAPCLRQLAAP